MLPMIALLLVFQLAGEALRHALALPVPGPVLGMLGLLLALALRGAWMRRRRADGAVVPEALERVTATLLEHLSLLFVPAGVGVVTHLSLLASEAVPLGVALVASTLLAVAAGGLLMARAVRRRAS
ncbi:CidA/LrgA family protein [Roseospira visakhapatnamensis]|uniref:Holin-like protein n=1 Tax=Roseospira visakhapatnamensis TaxID=390880 RepID=A0A7W6RCM5_9PROT|nr:CidA/LrgA family protein [Roseospira visakhapatnamensis]MBB4265935.1 holin-like protein [Roseospira visakhapatnamensis]